MKRTCKLLAMIIAIAMLASSFMIMLSKASLATDVKDAETNVGGSEQPNEKSECTVDFGTGKWTIGNTVVSAAIWGMDSLDIGPFKLDDQEPIKLDNFDPNTMQIKISAPDGFWTTLSIDGDHTLLRNIPEGVNLPREEVVLTFTVEAKPAGDNSVEPGDSNSSENPGGPVNPEDSQPVQAGGEEDISFDIEFTDTYVNVWFNNIPVITDEAELTNRFVGTIGKAGTTNNEETNRFQFTTSFNENEVEEYVINGVTYTEKDAVDVREHDIFFDVPGAEKYTIRAEGIPNPDKANTIIWANVNADQNAEEYDEDMVLEHGTARVIAVYDLEDKLVNPDEYIGEHSNEYGVDDKGFGWVYINPDYRVVFEFVPEYGYQLTSVKANGFDLEPQEAVNQYEFTMPRTNIHFAAVFSKTEDVVKTESKNVTSGRIVMDGNVLDGGTAKLEVSDIALQEAKIREFEEAAENCELKHFINIDLFQVFYKGKADSEDVWTNEIDELERDAEITLKLDEGINVENVVIIHNVHNGDEYEVIRPDSFDKEANTVTFRTKSFSNYAIATKPADAEPVNITLSDSETKTIIEFMSEDGHPAESYEFAFMDIGNLSEEEVKAFGLTKEEYDAALKLLKDNVSKEGTLIKFVNIEVRIPEEDRGISEGPFTVKIPYTDEMKEFNVFKVAYVNTDDFSLEDIVEFKLEGNYLVGTIKHLSPYVLIGKTTQETDVPETINNVDDTKSEETKIDEKGVKAETVEEVAKPTNSNPITGDNIIVFASIFMLSTLTLAFELITIKKSK